MDIHCGAFCFFVPQTVTLKVAMTCGGCEAAVKRVLSKLEGQCKLVTTSNE